MCKNNFSCSCLFLIRGQASKTHSIRDENKKERTFFDIMERKGERNEHFVAVAKLEIYVGIFKGDVILFSRFKDFIVHVIQEI